MSKNLIIVFLAVAGFAIAGIGTAAAAHTTSISVFHNQEMVDYIDIAQGNILEVRAGLYVDGGELDQWFRTLRLKIYDPDGKLLYDEERSTGFGTAVWNIKSKNWGSGEYNLVFSYDGNEFYGYPATEKEISFTIY